MRKSKSDPLAGAVLQRDVAALKRRVQALEKAVWPATKASGHPIQAGHRLIEVDEAIARRAVIEAFHKEERQEWLRNSPHILEVRRADRERLNKYLRERGFEPEPDIDE